MMGDLEETKEVFLKKDFQYYFQFLQPIVHHGIGHLCSPGIRLTQWNASRTRHRNASDTIDPWEGTRKWKGTWEDKGREDGKKNGGRRKDAMGQRCPLRPRRDVIKT